MYIYIYKHPNLNFQINTQVLIRYSKFKNLNINGIIFLLTNLLNNQLYY